MGESVMSNDDLSDDPARNNWPPAPIDSPVQGLDRSNAIEKVNFLNWLAYIVGGLVIGIFIPILFFLGGCSIFKGISHPILLIVMSVGIITSGILTWLLTNKARLNLRVTITVLTMISSILVSAFIGFVADFPAPI
jgi:hypothetical protein